MDQNIILLFGGESDERLVSTASAQAMAEALGEPIIWFLSKEGLVYLIDLKDLINHRDAFTKEFIPTSKAIFINLNEALAKLESNFIFVLALHGGQGEDGTIQALLQKYNRKFTGSNAQASKLAFDKIATKERLKHFNISLAPQLILEPTTLKEKLSVFLQEHKKIIIKPICGGSSIGSFYIKNHKDLACIIDKVNQAPAKTYFAEKFISGRELSVGVIDNLDAPMGLPVTEIIVNKDNLLDYEGKYLGLGSKEITPANISESLTREAQRLAVAAHAALKLDGYSRSDMILSQDKLYYLETNTLPGLAKESILPQQLAALNITLREFLITQIKFAQQQLKF